MKNFQEKYFEAINSLMSAQEENYKLKNQLSSSIDTEYSSKKLEKVHESLIEALDANAKLESRITELKKSKISSEVYYKSEIQNLKSKILEFQETFSKISNLNQELLVEGKCILCSRSCACHLSLAESHVSVIRKFKKSPFISTESLPIHSQSSTVGGEISKPARQRQTIPHSTTRTETQKENLEKIRPKQEKLKTLTKLVSWRSVVKETRPKGTLTFLPKKTTILIEEGIINDFLVERVEKELLENCKIEEGAKTVPAIPEPLIEEFDEWLDYILDAQSLDKKDDNLISWMDIVSQELGSDILNIILADMEYHHRVVKAIRLYLKKFASSAKISFEACWIRKMGDIENVPAIPKSLQESFVEWFKPLLEVAFYSTGGSDSKKRKVDSVYISDDDG